jgi:type I restriction enzyme S subunit
MNAQQSTRLPSGWRLVRLSDVAEQCLGKMLDAKKNKGRLLPYLRNPNVRWLHVDTSDLQEMPFEDHELERYGLREGDVLVCEGGEAGRAAIWDGHLPDVKFQKAIHRIRTGPELFNRYLVHRLMADYHSGRLADYYTGATIKHLTGQDLARLEFPLPPLAEQRRIAEVLDRAEALRAKRRAALAHLDTLTQALFFELFGDPVVNTKGWPLKKLGAIGNLDRGVSKHRPRNAKELLGGPYPLVQTGEVANCDGYIREYHSTYSDIGLRQSKMWPAGTLCITIAANIAKTGILTFDACFPDSVVGFRTEDPATVEFVRTWISFLQKTLEETAPEVAQKNINLAILRDLDVPLPPLALQREFARRVVVVAKLKAAHRASLAQMDALCASLQHRAFRGEL